MHISRPTTPLFVARFSVQPCAGFRFGTTHLESAWLKYTQRIAEFEVQFSRLFHSRSFISSCVIWRKLSSFIRLSHSTSQAINCLGSCRFKNFPDKPCNKYPGNYQKIIINFNGATKETTHNRQ